MAANRDKSALYPRFAKMLLTFEARLSAAKLPFFLFMGLRTWGEQDALYRQGRTAPGKIVTNARGGDSWHQYAVGADYILDGQTEKPGVQWNQGSWDVKADLNRDGHNDWRQMAEIALACGLEPGFFWKSFSDPPHVQHRFGLTIQEAKELYRRGGMPAVWTAFDKA